MLVEGSFACEDLFLTLTFEREETTLGKDVEDPENRVKRLRDRFSDFRYIAVRFFLKRCTSHFHVLMRPPQPSEEAANAPGIGTAGGTGAVRCESGEGHASFDTLSDEEPKWC